MTRPEMDQHLGGTPPAEFVSDLEKLRILIDRFFASEGEFAPHATLGQTSRTERMRHAYLHMDHHLRQFGAYRRFFTQIRSAHALIGSHWGKQLEPGDVNMTGTTPTSSEQEQRNELVRNWTLTWERMGILYARIALGCAFLSAVADRFGLWGKYGGWGNFANFVRYTAQVNSFMPAFTISFLAWAATVAETTLGILLIMGLWLRWVALGSAILLGMFGTAMAISFGLKSPLDYSVFSASGAAVLLALRAFGRENHRLGFGAKARN